MALRSELFKSNHRLQNAAMDSPPMRRPERGQAVGLLQTALLSWAMRERWPGRSAMSIMPRSIREEDGPCDGVYGGETAGLVIEFERANQLALDSGIAGREVLHRLDAFVMRSLQVYTATTPTVTKPKYILAAIDGTHSYRWLRPDRSNSHTYQFYCSFRANGGTKSYFHGPELPGFSVPNIVTNVLRFINRSWNDYPDAKVCLVGHSRGGLIAIMVAKRLRPYARVRFLGLYDAVDRADEADGSIIENVDIAYHALRHPTVRSRWYFGNTGRRAADDVQLEQEWFRTTHGGVGGDPVGGHAEDIMIHSREGVRPPEPLLRVSLAQSRVESARANRFIRDGARAAGLEFEEACVPA